MSIKTGNFPTVVDVKGVVGDSITKAWGFRFKNADGSPKDISAIDYYYTVKNSFDDLDIAALLNKAPVDAVKTASDTVIDTVTFPLSKTDTETIGEGTKVHSMKELNGTEETTIMDGAIVLKKRRIDTI